MDKSKQSSPNGWTRCEKVLTLLVIILSVSLAAVLALYIMDMKKVSQAGSTSSSSTATLAPSVSQAPTMAPNETATIKPGQETSPMSGVEPSIGTDWPSTTIPSHHNANSTEFLAKEEDGLTTNVPKASNAAEKAAYQINKSIDYGVMPCDDFYQFACGRWLKETVLSEGQPSMQELLRIAIQITLTLKDLLGQPDNEKELPVIKKTKLFYRACIDKDSISQRGVEPLKEFLLNELGGWPLTYAEWNESSFDIVNSLVDNSRLGNLAIVSLFVGSDLKDNTKRRLVIDQPSLGIPGRNYYLRNRNDTILTSYEELINSVATGLGLANDRTVADVKALIDFEIKLATIMESDESKRVSMNNYNPMLIEDVGGNYSKVMDWTRYVNTLLSVPEVAIDTPIKDPIMNLAPMYYDKLGDVLNNTPNRTIANYLIWTFVYTVIKKGVVGNIFKDQLLKFDQVLYGAASESDLHASCVVTTTTVFTVPVGRMYVESYFDPEAKVIALEMIAELKNAFSELLKESNWMDEKTKQYAEEKKNHMISKIGYPNYIYNDTYIEDMFSQLEVNKTYFENIIKALRFSYIEHLRLLKKPIDKNEWTEASSETNAFYMVTSNQMVFPAGILQPPFYNKVFPKSMNYGGIGMVMGHEMIHGFDDLGRRYDKSGNLYNWWSEDAEISFNKKAKCMINQYGNFTLEPSKIKANGVRTIGENIADNGGLRQSFRAYRNWVKSQGHEEMDLPGLNFTHNQIFFISFAQIWCTKETDAAAQNHINTQAHSLAEFRVRGSIQNSEEFAEAFNCLAESKMNPSPKCQVW